MNKNQFLTKKRQFLLKTRQFLLNHPHLFGIFNTVIDKGELNVMETSLEILKTLNLFPRKQYDKYFFLRVLIMFPLIAFVSSGCVYHVIVNLKLNLPLSEYIEDFYIIIITMSILYFFPAFLFCHPHVIKLMDNLKNFDRFGVPDNSKEVNKFVNRAVFFYHLYVTSGSFCYLLLGLLANESCMAKRAKNHSQIVCGMMSTFCMPFDIDYFPVKQIMIVLQIWSGVIMVNCGTCLVSIGPACLEHVVMRIDHFIKLLDGVFDGDDWVRRQKLRKCVLYHNHIVDLVKLTNQSFSSITFLHLITSSVIISLILYSLIIEYNTRAVLILFGYILGVYVMCFGGQKLLDKGHEMNLAIFQIPWYKVDVSTQKEVLMMLMRSQKDMNFDALNVAVLSHGTFKTIIRSSYSVLAVLQRRGNR